jgi:hypothetical protein
VKHLRSNLYYEGSYILIVVPHDASPSPGNE